jgi:hypothetical protein
MQQLESQHISSIKENFSGLKTKEDLADLLNLVQEILYPEGKFFNGEEYKTIRTKTLTYYANPKLAKKRYKQFTIKKKSGGERMIEAPVPQLSYLQHLINVALNTIFQPNTNAMGFVPGKSIVDNASLHTNQNYVFNIDLKDYFPSVEFRRVKTVLQLKPFQLNDEPAFLIANLCCHEGRLPQGAPTSPTLTNVVCQRLDRKLTGLAKRFGCIYSRYADDITFSSMHNVYQEKGEFREELHRIIENENFRINPDKVRLQKNGYRKEVTGITVNEKTNLNRRYIRRLRAMLNNWEKYGLKKAEENFRKDYIQDKGNVKKHNANFIEVLRGKLDYMKMVRGENDLLLQKYQKQFINLYRKQVYRDINLQEILDVWEKEGIEKAMEFYYEIKNYKLNEEQ